MSRVSENSNTAALNHALNRAKGKMEDLQLKGSTLKSMTRPSDNPMSNIESLTIGSIKSDNEQYIKNGDFAKLHLNVAENTLASISDLIVRAKELAIQQASDFYNDGIRRNISNDVVQIRNQVLALANKRIGSKYIFSGFKTLTPPFTVEGEYSGDSGKRSIEISKDFFIPVNVDGGEVFFLSNDTSNNLESPVKDFKELKTNQEKMKMRELSEGKKVSRELASIDEKSVENDKFEKRENIFTLLSSFITALENNDAELIQGLLEKFDDATTRIITLRTRLGSLTNSVDNAQNSLAIENIDNAARNSKLVDADIAELFSDLTKQQEVLKTTYQSAKGILNQNLLNFIN